MKDYYKILRIPSNATNYEIKSSYKQLVSKFHPDKDNSINAVDNFKEIKEAYDTLSNNEKRIEYDKGYSEYLLNEVERLKGKKYSEAYSYDNKEINYCSNCGSKVTQKIKFCSNCGFALNIDSTTKNNSININNSNKNIITLDSTKAKWNWGAFAIFPIYMLAYNLPIGIVLCIGVIILNYLLSGYVVLAQVIFYLIGMYFGQNGEQFALENWNKNGRNNTEEFIKVQKTWNIVGIIIFIIVIIGLLSQL